MPLLSSFVQRVLAACRVRPGTVSSRSFRPRLEGLEERTLLDGRIIEYPLSSTDVSIRGLALGADGNVWFTQAHPDTGNKIGRITPAGQITDFPLGTVDALPSRIVAGPDGTLWFTEFNGNKLGRITAQGDITEFPLPRAQSQPNGITLGAEGNLWFAETSVNRIGRSTPEGQITEFVLPNSNSGPAHLVTGPDGNVWFTEFTGNRIGRISPDGQIAEFPLPSPNSVPTVIVVGPDQNLWFTEFGGNRIGRFSLTGVLTEFTLPQANSRPNAITVGPDGNLWFTLGAGSANAIGRITPEGQFIEQVSVPTAQASPALILTGRDGNLWFSEVTGDKLGVLQLPDASTRFLEALYQQALGRTLAPGDANYWNSVLVRQGTSPVVQGIELSVEARLHQVQSWFQQFLDRSAEPAAQQYFVGLLGTATEEQVLSQILASDEYLARTPQLAGRNEAPGEATLIGALYQQFLQRAPSDVEVTWWREQLRLRDRAGLAQLLLGTAEYRSRIVQADYQNLLQRTQVPSAEEVRSWVDSGLDLRAIRMRMESTVEFYHQNQGPVNQRFLQTLYQKNTGRPASLADQTFWLEPLVTQGLAPIVAVVEHADESRQQTIQRWFATYLGRLPAANERQFFLQALQGGASEEQVLSVLLASDEYVARSPQIPGVGGGAPSADTYIAALYEQLLDRAASQGDLAFWRGRLQAEGRGAVALALLQSTEYRTLAVHGYYLDLLGRSVQPSLTEVAGWAASGLDLQTIRQRLQASPVFFQNA